MADQDDDQALKITDRRRVLKAAGITALAGGAAVLSARPAEATNGDAVTVGGSFLGTSQTALTSNAGTATLRLDNTDSVGGGLTAFAAGGIGVFGTSTLTTGIGVQGTSDAGSGVIATSANGTALRVEGSSFQSLMSAAGAPTSGSYDVGHEIKDLRGDRYMKTLDGWVKVGRLIEGYNGGLQHQLSKPIRLIDTRAGKSALHPGGGQYAAGSTHTLQVSNLTYLGVTIPATATGIVGNLTVTGTAGHGYVILYPNGQAQPVTSNLNFEKGQTLANAFTLTVGTANSIKIYVNGSATDLLFDVVAFIA